MTDKEVALDVAITQYEAYDEASWVRELAFKQLVRDIETEPSLLNRARVLIAAQNHALKHVEPYRALIEVSNIGEETPININDKTIRLSFAFTWRSLETSR